MSGHNTVADDMEWGHHYEERAQHAGGTVLQHIGEAYLRFIEISGESESPLYKRIGFIAAIPGVLFAATEEITEGIRENTASTKLTDRFHMFVTSVLHNIQGE